MIRTERLPIRKPRAEEAVERWLEHWGAWEIGMFHGSATEPALALRDWGSAERPLTRLVSLIQHGNRRSIRVAEKLGERYERDVEVRGTLTRLYSFER